MLKKIFFPFGLGKRQCVGMNLAKLEIKYILATLFQNYNFDIKSDKENIDTEYTMLWAPKDVLCSFYKR